MDPKHDKINGLIEPFQGQDLDARYLAYFDCFNRQLFFEAHEVLEALWLTERNGPRDLFYRGLIQLAGAFVHVQKGRASPALALLRLARKNLGQYPERFERLDLSLVRRLVADWLGRLERATPRSTAFESEQVPHLTPPAGT